jgi:hypothetical protein
MWSFVVEICVILFLYFVWSFKRNHNDMAWITKRLCVASEMIESERALLTQLTDSELLECHVGIVKKIEQRQWKEMIVSLEVYKMYCGSFSRLAVSLRRIMSYELFLSSVGVDARNRKDRM